MFRWQRYEIKYIYRNLINLFRHKCMVIDLADIKKSRTLANINKQGKLSKT